MGIVSAALSLAMALKDIQLVSSRPAGLYEIILRQTVKRVFQVRTNPVPFCHQLQTMGQVSRVDINGICRQTHRSRIGRFPATITYPNTVPRFAAYRYAATVLAPYFKDRI